MNGSTLEATASIFERLSTLADTTRARLLLVLEGNEFTVSELCTILQMPQSTVSRHLKVLADEGWLLSRPEGTSRRYRMASRGLDEGARELWELVGARAADLPAARQDALRVRSVLAERRTTSEEFFASKAGDWDRVRDELFGSRSDLQALPGLLDPDWVVGDLGCGTGRVSRALAPFVARVVAVDGSKEMLTAAAEHLEELDNVERRQGALEHLPVVDGELDAAVSFLVLHYVPEPDRVLAEAGRALRPGGRLLLVDVTPHDRQEYQTEMGHLWLGFSEGQIRGWLDEAGFEQITYHPLPPDPEASGPAIFAAAARLRPEA